MASEPSEQPNNTLISFRAPDMRFAIDSHGNTLDTVDNHGTSLLSCHNGATATMDTAEFEQWLQTHFKVSTDAGVTQQSPNPQQFELGNLESPLKTKCDTLKPEKSGWVNPRSS